MDLREAKWKCEYFLAKLIVTAVFFFFLLSLKTVIFTFITFCQSDLVYSKWPEVPKGCTGKSRTLVLLSKSHCEFWWVLGVCMNEWVISKNTKCADKCTFPPVICLTSSDLYPLKEVLVLLFSSTRLTLHGTVLIKYDEIRVMRWGEANYADLQEYIWHHV